MKTPLLKILAPALLVIACGTPVAMAQGSGGLFGGGGSTKLPSFSIGEPGTHTFQVRGLKKRAYPYKLDIQTKRPATDSAVFHPKFDGAVFKIEIIDGGVVASKVFKTSTWRVRGTGKYDQIFWSPKEPALPYKANYTVRITVLKPSGRSRDTAKIVLR